MTTLTKSLLFGISLCFCLTLGSADFSNVMNLVSEVLQRSPAGNMFANIQDHINYAKYIKRDIITKHLEDPDDCIRHCLSDQSSATISASLNMAFTLAQIAFSEAVESNRSNPMEQEQLKKNLEDLAVILAGVLFEDLCNASKVATDCFNICPQSLLRNITILNHNRPEKTCEPRTYWNNFTEFYQALNCINATSCEDKCGLLEAQENASRITWHQSKSSGFVLRYETDPKKNAMSYAEICKSTSCDLECNKPIISEKCGSKAYDYYVRSSKSDPLNKISILKELNAIDDVKECDKL